MVDNECSNRAVDSSHLRNDEVVTSQTYLLAIATIKRDLIGLAQSSRSYARHKRILDENVITIDGIDCLSVLVNLDIEHEVLLRDGFSQTKEWGRLHYFYVKLVGAQTIASGVAALLGSLFQQDAIGITYLLSDNEYEASSLHQGHSLSSNAFHPYFIVHFFTSMSRDTMVDMMECVCQYFSKISAQLDPLGKTIEFHDYDSSSKINNEDIAKVLKENFDEKFFIEARFIKTTLLYKTGYQLALDRLNHMIKWNEFISKHKINLS